MLCQTTLTDQGAVAVHMRKRTFWWRTLTLVSSGTNMGFVMILSYVFLYFPCSELTLLIKTALHSRISACRYSWAPVTRSSTPINQGGLQRPPCNLGQWLLISRSWREGRFGNNWRYWPPVSIIYEGPACLQCTNEISVSLQFPLTPVFAGSPMDETTINGQVTIQRRWWRFVIC